MALVLGWAHFQTDEVVAARVAVERAVDAEPKLAAAWNYLARIDLVAGQIAKGVSAIDRCLDVSAGASTDCVGRAEQIAINEARCSTVERYAMQLVARSPLSPARLGVLANAEWALGDEAGAIATLERMAPAGSGIPLPERFGIEALRGQFVEAGGTLEAWRRSVEASPDAWAHYLPYRWHAYLALERGDLAEAKRVSEEFLRLLPGWAPDELRFDPRIHFMETLYRAGALTHDEFARGRKDWLNAATAGGRHDPVPPGTRWLTAYVQTVVTPNDAEEALRAGPAFLPVPGPSMRSVPLEMRLGETLLLAGQTDEAIPVLRRAAGWCSPLQFPLYVVWARARLGEALERAGDRASACTAYASVLSAWGAAKPRSVTAERVRVRATQLRCGSSAAE
jgi:serine/threonine-protein kinase